jgi:hypothetical protein
MASPATLLSLTQAKAQLRVTHDEEDFYIEEVLADAEDIIASFMGDLFDADWTPQTVPGAVRAAILKQMTYMWSHRGEDAEPTGEDSGLAPGVRWLLQANGYRDLTIG